MTKLFSTNGGLFFSINSRCYGQQDKGISPAGAQDQTSFLTAYNLLGKPDKFQAIEMLYPTAIQAQKDILIVVCGANYDESSVYVQSGNNLCLQYNEVINLNCGDSIEFKGDKKGFRSLIVAIEVTAENKSLIGIKRSKELADFVQLGSNSKELRVTIAPEFFVLKDNSFFEQTWQISSQSSQMGLSLEGNVLDTKKLQMISQPVTDGCIQLSPSGPIVLMRHRQTVGGYPRIVTIIEQDIDKLAQMPIGTRVKFKLISLAEAVIEVQKYRTILQ